MLSLILAAQLLSHNAVIYGRVSEFGGPNDHVMKPNEGLALIERSDLTKPKFQYLFLKSQPKGTTGLARRLNPNALYCALRFDYKKTPKETLKYKKVLVSANGKCVVAKPVDWGPHPSTGKVADLSPGVLRALGISSGSKAHLALLE